MSAPVLKRTSLRRLLTGPAPASDRILHHNIWFRDHNNQRYSALLPRLDRVDNLFTSCSSRPLLRYVQFQALQATAPLRHRWLFRAARRRYRFLFVTNPEHIPYFSGRVVADVDDPTFTEREARLLARDNVAAYVVTAGWAAERLRSLGVRTPAHVIPQGVDGALFSAEEAAEVARRHRRPGEIVVGYVAAWLVSAGDRHGSDPMYNIDHLLELWGAIHERLPSARLWLIGQVARHAREKCRGRPDILLFGRLPRERVSAHVENFDLALYVRRPDPGVQAIKLAEYMGRGVPTVAYDVPRTQVLHETGAGLLARSPEEFVEAVLSLAREDDLRGRLRAAALRAAPALDWDVLARRYQSEILDRYLPPDGSPRV